MKAILNEYYLDLRVYEETYILFSLHLAIVYLEETNH